MLSSKALSANLGACKPPHVRALHPPPALIGRLRNTSGLSCKGSVPTERVRPGFSGLSALHAQAGQTEPADLWLPPSTSSNGTSKRSDESEYSCIHTKALKAQYALAFANTQITKTPNVRTYTLTHMRKQAHTSAHACAHTCTHVHTHTIHAHTHVYP